MTTIADTVYPRLHTSPDDAELAWAFTPLRRRWRSPPGGPAAPDRA